MKNLVVILILVHKQSLTKTEKASLHQCCTILKNYPIRLICPKDLNVSEYRNISSSIVFDFIEPKWQADYRMFNKLKIHPFLYNRYRKYRFILFYELDAWVFKDELEYWCNKGYDYIGAPWFANYHEATPFDQIIGVGNGGFSLRKCQAHIDLISKIRKIAILREYRNYNILSLLSNILTFAKKLIKAEQSKLELDYDHQEDIFWTIDAPNFVNETIKFRLYFLHILHAACQKKKLNVGVVEDAIKFSFEVNPRVLYNNLKKLPFGCHAWERYDQIFWKKFIDIH